MRYRRRTDGRRGNMRAILVLVAATLGFVLPGTAAAAGSIVFVVHGAATFRSPTPGCPGGRALTQLQVPLTGETARASACVLGGGVCGDGCFEASIRYTYRLAAGRIRALVTQRQYADAAGAVAGIVATGQVVRVGAAYADLVGSSVVGGGALMFHPDGSATLHAS